MYRASLLSLVAVALCASSGLGAPPKAPGPRVAQVGEVFEIEIEEDAAGPVVLQNPYPLTELFVREAKPSRPKTVAYIIQPKKDGVFRLTLWTKGDTVGEAIPVTYYEFTAGIAPVPVPPKPKPLPDGELGLIKASREGFAKVKDGRDKAAALAEAQRSHASAVAAGAFGDDPAKILSGWREANRMAVSATDYAEWGAAVSTRLAQLHTAGKLKTRTEWSAAFSEISEGLPGE